MYDFELFHEVIRCRHTDVTAYFYPEFIWKQETAIFCEDIDKSIAFVEGDCSDEEFYWLSEVFADIAEQSQSAAFVHALRERLAQVTDSEWREELCASVQKAAEKIAEG